MYVEDKISELFCISDIFLREFCAESTPSATVMLATIAADGMTAAFQCMVDATKL